MGFSSLSRFKNGANMPTVWVNTCLVSYDMMRTIGHSFLGPHYEGSAVLYCMNARVFD
jgi:hypothetical protein